MALLCTTCNGSYGVGCEVEALCPADHPMLQSSVIRKHRIFHPLSPLRSIRSAIHRSAPEFIIPGDELAVLYLHRIHAKANAEVRALIERSLGDPAHYALAHSCNNVMAMAREEGVATPLTAEVHSPAEIPGWPRASAFRSFLRPTEPPAARVFAC